ncbi:MAG: glycoside hydrolase family 3 C-terminal domain-containing protein [Flavihumibacter sp.]
MKGYALLILLLFTCIFSTAQTTPLYKDPAQPVDARVKDLLSRMTPEEKFWQLFMIPGDLDHTTPDQYRHGIFGFQVSAGAKGDAGGQLLTYNTAETGLVLLRKIKAIQQYFEEKSRLGIPIIAFDEALHGLVREGATSFPQAIALAASWDTALMQKVANAIADETKARGIRDVLTPVVNIASDVRWGRTEETYGEDPFLSSEMGVAFVSAFEKKGIVTTPKHFLANVADGGRDSYPVFWNERKLRELYLPPFKACIERGGARSIMTAYNAVDGTASSSNSRLLRDILTNEWGFKGFVISDASAVGGEVVLHHTAKNYAESGAHAVSNGLDVIFQTDYDHYKLFQPAFLDGRIPQQRIDEAVSRVLRIKFELGLFEHPYVEEAAIIALQQSTMHKKLAQEAAEGSLVLLKNENNTLPLKAGIKRIAVIGEEAVAARLGGYSGTGNGKVAILNGIRSRAKNAAVEYVRGAGVFDTDWSVVPDSVFSSGGNKGLQLDIFNNIRLSGKPVETRTESGVHGSWTLYPPAASLTSHFYSLRWTGKLKAPFTGTCPIGIEGNDGYRLYINDSLWVDRWEKTSYTHRLKPYPFVKGSTYNIKVEFFETTGNGKISLVWQTADPLARRRSIDSAVALARRSDVAVFAAGIHEGEFQDRAYLSLPGHQEELIKAVAATGKPVIVLLTGGSAITMSAWMDKTAAIVHTWYAGEAGGDAIAAILFGDKSPGGKLPITFPVHESQLPLVYNHHPTGRGDDYHNLSGQPLFPFGYGLSYTHFEYGPLALSRDHMAASDTATLSCTIKNTGNYDGTEVVQLYITDLLCSVTRPVMELKGFQKIFLQKGASATLQFRITPNMLSMLDKNLRTVVEPGQFLLRVGSSSRDIRSEILLTIVN